jgi:polyisoprenoid-binding protein YceI
MKKILLSAFLFALIVFKFALYAFAPAEKIIRADKANSFIQYTVNHPFHSATAVTNNFICNIDFNSDTRQVNKVVVAVGLGTFDSKNSNRDSNAMEAVEALRFPSVKFISTSIAFAENKLAVTGNLTFHGITKEISFSAQQKINLSLFTVTGSFTVSLDEFKVERPSLLGMKVDDAILIEFKTVFII